MEKIDVTVVIPTLNRAKLLKGALDSIFAAKTESIIIEVIVIDNGSTDGTKELCEEYRTNYSNFLYVQDNHPGLHVGRNLGIKLSKGEILIFFDDDIEVSSDIFITIFNVFSANSNVALVSGKVLPKWQEKIPFWLWKKWNIPDTNGHKILGDLSLLDLGDKEKEINPYYIFGCCFAVKKSILLDARGFHPDGMPQDLIKYRGDGESYISHYVKNSPNLVAVYNPKSIVYHFVTKERMSLDYFAQRSFNQGVSDSYTYLRNNKTILNTKKNYNILSKLKNIIKTIIGFERNKLIIQLHNFLLLDEVDIIKNKNYLTGYKYHQQAYKHDMKVQEWVHKSDYLDENGWI